MNPVPMKLAYKGEIPPSKLAWPMPQTKKMARTEFIVNMVTALAMQGLTTQDIDSDFILHRTSPMHCRFAKADTHADHNDSSRDSHKGMDPCILGLSIRSSNITLISTSYLSTDSIKK